MTDAYQILILALTIWFEARGEGSQGMRFVADTIYNRASGNPTAMLSVVLKPRQYSCWDSRDPESADVPTQTGEVERNAWAQCVSLSKAMLSGSYQPFTPATHYWKRGFEAKAWQFEMEIVVEYKNHIFAKKTSVTNGETG